MGKNFDFNKEACRGTLKQIMKVKGLRSINLANYCKLFNKKYGILPKEDNIHSLKFDIQDGYINAYNYGINGKCGNKIEDVPSSTYIKILELVQDILSNEHKLNYKTKRNILVKLSR